MSTGTNVTNPAPTSLRHAQEVIREAQHELNQLLRQRVTIMRRIGTVKQTLICLAVPWVTNLYPERSRDIWPQNRGVLWNFLRWKT